MGIRPRQIQELRQSHQDGEIGAQVGLTPKSSLFPLPHTQASFYTSPRQGSNLLQARRETGSEVSRVLAGLSAPAQTPCGSLVEMTERPDGEDCPSVSGLTGLCPQNSQGSQDPWA